MIAFGPVPSRRLGRSLECVLVRSVSTSDLINRLVILFEQEICDSEENPIERLQGLTEECNRDFLSR